MRDFSIVESKYGIVVTSPDFRIGKGFVFPYGGIEPCMSGSLYFAGCEPETHAEAEQRLERLQGCFAGARVVKPQLHDLAYIFGFISGLPDADYEDKFISLLASHCFFGFDKSYLKPGKAIVVADYLLIEEFTAGGGRDFPIRDPRMRVFPHDAGTKANFQRYASRDVMETKPLLPEKKPLLLERLIGARGVTDVKKILCRASPVFVGSIAAIQEKPVHFLSTVLSLPLYYDDVQLESVTAALISDSEEHYRDQIVQGVPYIGLESRMGTDPERGAMIYDELWFAHDFWAHEPDCTLYGYTLGVLQ